MKNLFFLASIIFCTLGIASFGISQDMDQSCQQTLQNNCARCHGLKKICSKLDKAETNWKAIVTDMGKKGKLSQDVQDAAVTCLTKGSDPQQLICDK
jgi:hypothetical protein